VAGAVGLNSASRMMTADETPEAMQARLLQVIAQAQFDALTADYAWRFMGANEAPQQEAIACVRDGNQWYQFAPAAVDASAQRYRVVSFHFMTRLWPRVVAAPGRRWCGRR
jgi:hypothetical protein